MKFELFCGVSGGCDKIDEVAKTKDGFYDADLMIQLMTLKQKIGNAYQIYYMHTGKIFLYNQITEEFVHSEGEEECNFDIFLDLIFDN